MTWRPLPLTFEHLKTRHTVCRYFHKALVVIWRISATEIAYRLTANKLCGFSIGGISEVGRQWMYNKMVQASGAACVNLLYPGVVFTWLQRAVSQSCLSTGWQQRPIKSPYPVALVDVLWKCRQLQRWGMDIYTGWSTKSGTPDLFCSITLVIVHQFLRASAMLKHVIAIGLTSVCLSVRHTLAPYQNGWIYCHAFFTTR